MSESKARRGGQANPGGNVNALRNMVLGGVALLIGAVAVTGLLYTTGDIGGDIVEGTHFHLVEDAPEDTSGPIVVSEFFSWACIHCRNLEPHLQEWKATAPTDAQFERVPVGFSPAWRTLARAWYTFDSLGVAEANFERMFVALHDQRRSFAGPEDIAAVAVEVDAGDFMDAWHSPAVRRTQQASDQRAQRLGINSTPIVVVADRYLIRASEAGGGARMVAVIDHVINLERERRSQGAG